MGSSKVTDYFAEYLQENSISIQEVFDATGIAPEKLTKEYEEPLCADEFLDLCVFLSLRPEEIRENIRRKKQ